VWLWVSAYRHAGGRRSPAPSDGHRWRAGARTTRGAAADAPRVGYPSWLPPA